jgi:hypothetical protein
MRTRQGASPLKVDVGGETVRVFGRPEELAERLEASPYDILASEIDAGMELHLPCLAKVGPVLTAQERRDGSHRCLN